ncbi:MAG: response regulator [Desulfobacteraceae bacterium]|nr:response regulator [Desulfobacteraceae bacterium]
MARLKVLIIDDEPDFLETLVKRLNRRNVDAVGVQSGEEAMAILGQREFDVAILDVRMPGMDGIETLKAMKRRSPLMEVIMLTGHASVESGVQGMRFGAYDYMIKPADFEELFEKINQAGERKLLHEKKIRKA